MNQALNYKWYVVRVSSGHEQQVKKSIEERLKFFGKIELLKQIIIPQEQIVNVGVTKQERKTYLRRVAPGYIFLQMIYDADLMNLVRKSSKSVLGFIPNNTSPQPVSDEEVAHMMNVVSPAIGKEIITAYFKNGDMIKVIEGPFAGFKASVVEDYEPSKGGRIKATISIFGRQTPAEFTVSQVEKDENKSIQQ